MKKLFCAALTAASFALPAASAERPKLEELKQKLYRFLATKNVDFVVSSSVWLAGLSQYAVANCNMTDGDKKIQEMVYFEPNIPTAKALGVPESTFRLYAALTSSEILKVVELDALEGIYICRAAKGS
jgi:hypothetical protein